jgi:aspartyl-tRNA(Asn)/glutamyl-tRNA(Gln) amidotransferase subunit A
VYLSDIFTVPASLAGVPAISVPSGFSRGSSRWPFRSWRRASEEAMLFSAARAFEREIAVPDALPRGLRSD